MLRILFIVILFGLACYLILLIRSFEFMNSLELKRQARGGNIKAARVYKVRGTYGVELRILLWSLFGLTLTSIILLIDRTMMWTWLGVLISLLVVMLLHAILSFTRQPKPGLSLASTVSPILERTLHYLRPVLVPMRFVERWVDTEPSATVHSKEELLEILEQTETTDPVSKDELRIAASALTFGDQNISDIMTPVGVVKTVDSTDVLSPVILDELHDSGFSRFPVKSTDGHYVGTLYFKDAIVSQTSPSVKDVMRRDVYYVNEAAKLDQALKAFLKTQHHLFMVVNEFEDVVGVISIEDVLERIIGAKIVDEFDAYDDLRAVAKSLAEKRGEDRNHV